MYLRHYGFHHRPFQPTPDPRFLFFTPSHHAALRALEQGVRDRRGILVLTGEIGTGKTTLLHTLRKRIDPRIDTAFVYDSKLSFDQIIEYVIEDFGIDRRGARADRLGALHRFLDYRRRYHLDTLLIIDEAQNLEVDTLEQIRLFFDAETTGERLLQILLSGQIELARRLEHRSLGALGERIGVRCEIDPMTADEIRDYVLHRLRIARSGGRDGESASEAAIFTDAALARIAHHAAGIPRVASLLCDHCLLIGYAEGRSSIGPDVVEEAIETLEEGVQPAQSPAAGAAASGFRPSPDLPAGVWARLRRSAYAALLPSGKVLRPVAAGAPADVGAAPLPADSQAARPRKSSRPILLRDPVDPEPAIERVGDRRAKRRSARSSAG